MIEVYKTGTKNGSQNAPLYNNNNGPPWGLYCFLYIITFYNFTVHADTDIEADDVGNFSVELAETRSWDLGVFLVFPHISAAADSVAVC